MTFWPSVPSKANTELLRSPVSVGTENGWSSVMLPSGGSWYANPSSVYTVRWSTCWIAESTASSTVLTGLTNHRPFSRTTLIEIEPLAGVELAESNGKSPNGTDCPRSPDRQMLGAFDVKTSLLEEYEPPPFSPVCFTLTPVAGSSDETEPSPIVSVGQVPPTCHLPLSLPLPVVPDAWSFTVAVSPLTVEVVLRLSTVKSGWVSVALCSIQAR